MFSRKWTFSFCVDIDDRKVALMSSGISPIYEPGLEELMVKNMDRLNFTTNYKEAYKDADVIFIGVGTQKSQMAQRIYPMSMQ